MSPLFGTKYDDGEIAIVVEQALTHAPAVDPTTLQPIVDEGVVRLEGVVPTEAAKRRTVDAVRQTLTASGVAYDRIEDDLVVA